MTPKIVLVLGTTFTGKSYAAGDLARHISRKFVVIVHTHPDRSYLLPQGKTRWIAVRSPHCTITPAFLLETRKHCRYLYLSIYDLSLPQTRLFLSSLAAAIRRVGDLALFVDEAHLFCGYQRVPEDFAGFIRGARFWGVDVVLVTHRLKDIDPGIRCVLTHLVVFRTTDQSDIELLGRELGIERTPEQFRGLPNREHLFVDRRTRLISPPQRV